MNGAEAVQQLVDTMLRRLPVSVSVGTVKDVDRDKRTCTVEREDRPTLFNVRLNSVISDNASYCTVFPQTGSYVLCLAIGDQADCYLLATSEVEEFVMKTGDSELKVNKDGFMFNGGSLGGMVKLETLVGKLNRLENRMGTHQHIYINSAGAPAPTTADGMSNAVIPQTKASELENKKILQ
jgi:hypothetical protein